MPAKVTDASAHRMAVRETFVGLTPGPYLTLENQLTGLPEIDITIEGLPEREVTAIRILAVLKKEFEGDRKLRVRVRRTA